MHTSQFSFIQDVMIVIIQLYSLAYVFFQTRYSDDFHLTLQLRITFSDLARHFESQAMVANIPSDSFL